MSRAVVVAVYTPGGPRHRRLTLAVDNVHRRAVQEKR